MSQAKITGRKVLKLLLKVLLGAVVLFIIVFLVAVPGTMDLPRSAYNYCRLSAVTIRWNGVEFQLPPPWFRVGKREQVPGTVTFFRDHFPWVEQVFSSITFTPPFPNDFAQNPEEGLRRWEQLKNKIWSVPNPYPKVIDSYYSEVHSAKYEYRCANTVRMAQSEKLIEIDCIETRSGWGFDYEGAPEDASEAISILENGS
jgi:hypothetical protein